MNLLPFVGIKGAGAKATRTVFKTREPLKRAIQFDTVLGPFRTLRAATFASLSPNTHISVYEWEKMAWAAEHLRRKR